MLTVLTNIRSAKVLWLMEDDLRWKMTFGGRHLSMEDNLACCLVCFAAFFLYLGDMSYRHSEKISRAFKINYFVYFDYNIS